MHRRTAIERLHSDASHVVGPNPDDKPTWINAVGVVNDIVRSFAADVLRGSGKAARGEWTHDAYMAWLNLECVRLNNLFLGYGVNADEEYKRGPWNTPDQLGHFIRIHHTPSDEENRFAVRDALAAYAVEIVTVTASHVGEDIEGWKDEIEAPTETLVRALLGLPSGNDPDDVALGDYVLSTEGDHIEREKAKRRPRFRLSMLDIKPGTVLQLEKNPEITCRTLDEGNKVQYNTVETTLSDAALQAINSMGHAWKAASGPWEWTYRGKRLDDLRRELEVKAE